jgi:hypothetical protein
MDRAPQAVTKTIIPDAAIEQHIAVLGKTGSGKTYVTKATIAEPLLAAGRTVGMIGPIEKLYGDYQPGRYAWMLREVSALIDPLPWKGKQGFFSVPDELLIPRAPAWFRKLAA